MLLSTIHRIWLELSSVVYDFFKSRQTRIPFLNWLVCCFLFRCLSTVRLFGYLFRFESFKLNTDGIWPRIASMLLSVTQCYYPNVSTSRPNALYDRLYRTSLDDLRAAESDTPIDPITHTSSIHFRRSSISSPLASLRSAATFICPVIHSGIQRF